jgi:hypothetical protein
MILLSARAGVGFKGPPSICPPVMQYSRTEQTCVAEEVATLLEAARFPEWLTDYAILREQVSSR